MKFCVECSNMYYIGINENNSNQMIYYCRNCGHTDSTITNESLCVLKTQLKKGGQTFNHIINKYTKLDPTLPRIYNIPCSNPQCLTNDSDESKRSPREIIYMRYDDNNMKYVYICTTCDAKWTTNDK